MKFNIYECYLSLMIIYFNCIIVKCNPHNNNNNNNDADTATVTTTTQSINHEHTAQSEMTNFSIDWMRTEVMDRNRMYILEWNIKENDIVFRVTVNTIGFIGLGFTHLLNNVALYDYVIVWIDDTNHDANILDCHSIVIDNKDANFDINSNTPTFIKDDTQNYEIIKGNQNDTHTCVEFKRSLKTCDPYDIEINGNTIDVLWSYGHNDPVIGNGITIGNKMGEKSLHLLTPLHRKPKRLPNVMQWDLIVNKINITSDSDTIYWCKIFQLPNLPKKHHIIGYEPLLTKDRKSNVPLVHHMTIFECAVQQSTTVATAGFRSSSLQWDPWIKNNGAVCNELLTERNRDSCITPVATWARGSTGQWLPEHVGIPMGGKRSKFYMLELHYDNPLARNIIDVSGIRLYYTQNLRKHDGGIMITGVSVSDTHIIPPKQTHFQSVGICGDTCTNSFFPSAGINLISVALHSHQLGHQMELKHIRNGTELQPIVQDLNYNYNYLQFRELSVERNVLPSDYLIVNCTYNTENRRRPTFGGYSTKQEMCLSFITYYPKIDLVGCYSMSPVKEYFEIFNVLGFSNYTMTQVENIILSHGSVLDLPLTKVHDLNNRDRNSNTAMNEDDLLQQQSVLNHLIISEPSEFHGKSFLAHLNELPWTETLFTSNVQKQLLIGDHMTFCNNVNQSIVTTKEIIRYPKYKIFENHTQECPYNVNLLMFKSNAIRLSNDFNKIQFFIITFIIWIRNT